MKQNKKNYWEKYRRMYGENSMIYRFYKVLKKINNKNQKEVKLKMKEQDCEVRCIMCGEVIDEGICCSVECQKKFKKQEKHLKKIGFN